MAIKLQGTGQDTARKTGLQTARLDKPDLDMVDEVYVDEFSAETKRAMESAGYKANILEFKVGKHLIRRDAQPVSYSKDGDIKGRVLDEDGRIKKFGDNEMAPCWFHRNANAEVLRARGYVPVIGKHMDGTEGPYLYGNDPMQLWMRPANKTLRNENLSSMEGYQAVKQIPTQEERGKACEKYQAVTSI